MLAWAKRIPASGAVLDLGCGSGVPIARALAEAGFAIHGVDASPAMVDAFRARLPHAPVECATVGASTFFGRHFDGIVAWGLIFLLAADEQARLIDKVSRALTPRGTFYFTVPWQVCEWSDALTGRISRSLGRDAYRDLLAAAAMTIVDEGDDDGENHYFIAARVAAPRDRLR